MLSLSEIKKAKGSSQTKKRVGRGNSSGHGTYSTRGLKGQKSRSGVSGLKRLGMRMQLLQTPKSRGFKSQKQKNQVISIKAINNNFKDGEVVNKDSLMEKGLILKKGVPVKILGKEILTVKVTVEGLKMSESVQGQLK